MDAARCRVLGDLSSGRASRIIGSCSHVSFTQIKKCNLHFSKKHDAFTQNKTPHPHPPRPTNSPTHFIAVYNPSNPILFPSNLHYYKHLKWWCRGSNKPGVQLLMRSQRAPVRILTKPVILSCSDKLEVFSSAMIIVLKAPLKTDATVLFASFLVTCDAI
jgi:hypothetical protein